jgi:phosphoglycerate dehydrogenase-like enzyme
LNTDTEKLNLFITSPLELEHVERIRAVAPTAVNVFYEPDLLPPTRYVADHKGVEGFNRSEEQERRWRACLARADVLWDFPVPGAEQRNGLSLAPNVRWVQTTSSGVGQLIKDLGLQDSNVLVTTARGVHAGPLAEFVFMALLIHCKNLEHLTAEKQRCHWARYCGDGLEGKTLALIGAGSVGRRVLAMARAFGMRTIVLGRNGGSATAEQIGADQMYRANDLHAMLSQADAVVLSMPHTPETEGMIDATAFAAMKPGSAFVNVARGAVVDEPALVAALETGHLGFAALDVFAVEPLPSDSRLWDLSNVLISPHSASTVVQENNLITDIFCRNLERYLSGHFDEMENLLDKTRMY